MEMTDDERRRFDQLVTTLDVRPSRPAVVVARARGFVRTRSAVIAAILFTVGLTLLVAGLSVHVAVAFTGVLLIAVAGFVSIPVVRHACQSILRMFTPFCR
jgi:hypothetical protein